MPSYTADAQISRPTAPQDGSGAPSTVQADSPPGALPTPTGLRPIVAYVSSTSDPHNLGTRVVEPARDTRQAVRGSLYAVVELSGAPAPVDVTERLLSLLQRTYYTARGSQSAVVSEAVRSALSVVQEYNARNPTAPLRVSLCCATMVQQRLLLACVGAAFAMLRSGERIELYPNQPDKTLPLDPQASSHIEVLKWEMAANDVALLCGPGWIDRLPIKTLAATVYYVTSDTTEEAAEGLREQAGGSVGPGLLLVMQPALPAPPTRPPTPLTAPRRAAPAGLPTSLSAQPPVTAPAAPSGPPTAQPAAADAPFTPPVLETEISSSIPAFLRRSDMAAGLSLDPPARPPANAQSANFEPFPVLAVQTVANAQGAEPAAAAESEDAEEERVDGPSATAKLVTGAREGADRARLFFRQMLPEKRTPNPADFELLDNESTGATSPSADAPEAANAPVASAAAAAQAAVQTPGAFPPRTRAAATVAAPALLPGAPLPAPDYVVDEPPPFAPPAPASGSRARLFITLAILVALLVPVTVGAYYWQIGANNRAEAEKLIALAQTRISMANDSLNGNEMRAALDQASEAQDFIDRSVELIGPTEASNELSAQVNRIEQESSNTKLLYGLTSPLIVFPEGASPTRLLVVDQDIYILDPGRALVERYRLDDSLEQLATPDGVPVLTNGQIIDGAAVGDLIDMAWQPVVPGYDDKATLLVLDSNNHIFRYDPRVEGPSLLDMGAAADFKSLRQMETFNRRLYVADVGRGQVLRYPEGLYTEAPTEWFSAPVNLDDMKTMRIDGDVWLLLKNGQLLRFFGGEQVSFSLDNSVGLMREPVDFTIGDGTNPNIYVADRGGERVWVFDRDGKYIKQFAAPEGNPLRGLSAIGIEDVTDSLFLLTPTALYKHPLPTD